jgi:putative salt-induced outer membrane protein YdiY
MYCPTISRCIVFLLVIAFSQYTTIADEVIMKNGDRVTGSVVKKEGNNLTIKTEKFGLIVTPWDQVESINTDKPLHIILSAGKTYEGMLNYKDGSVRLTDAKESVNVTPADISILRNSDEQKAYDRLYHSGWTQLWAGVGTIGLSGTAGNSKTLTYNIGLNANRTTSTDKTAVYFNLIKSSALVNGVDENTAEAIRGGISYNHNLNSRIFLSVFNDYEYDRFQNLDLRFVIGGGLGYHAVKTDRSRLDLLAGGAYNRSSYSTDLVTKSGEIYWGDEYNLKLSTATTLTQNFRMFNNLSETGAYRMNFDLGLGTKITKWLTWNVSVSDRYLSDPVPGRKTNDFLYTTGVGISFAR